MTNKTDWNENELETQINALLDGELDAPAIAALKDAAGEDQALARQIIDAYQLQQALDRLEPEQAPKHLSQRLKRIPATEKRSYGWQRWAVAAAVVPVLTVAVVTSMTPQQPSMAELQQTREDLAVAFAYIDQVSNKAQKNIEHRVGTDIGHTITNQVMGSLEND